MTKSNSQRIAASKAQARAKMLNGIESAREEIKKATTYLIMELCRHRSGELGPVQASQLTHDDGPKVPPTLSLSKGGRTTTPPLGTALILRQARDER